MVPCLRLPASRISSSTPPVTQKQLLGQAFYPLVVKALPETSDKAPKITGMLLEMEPSEVFATIESEDEIKAKVEEVLSVPADPSYGIEYPLTLPYSH